MTVWFQFIFCAAVILYSGTRLSHYGELLANKSGLSKNWTGLVLLAVVTSLSQLVTSVSAVVCHDLPDMAISGLIGSCMFNLMVVGMLDLISKEKPISRMVQRGHNISVGFGIILVSLVALDILFGKNLPIVKIVRSMDPITIGFIPIYLIAMRLLYRFEKNKNQNIETRDKKDPSERSRYSLPKIIFSFALCAICIVVASSYLPSLVEDIQRTTHWGESFIGSTFIAATMSLPELAVGISAARRGSFDIAVASLLGSNLCYMVILAITDFCYMKEPLLRHASKLDALTALSTIISMGIIVIGLTYRAEKKFLFVAGDAIAIIIVYLLTNILLFMAH